MVGCCAPCMTKLQRKDQPFVRMAKPVNWGELVVLANACGIVCKPTSPNDSCGHVAMYFFVKTTLDIF